MAANSDDVNRLLAMLFEPLSLLQRVRHEDPRPGILAQIAASGEFRVVPALLPILARGDSLSRHAAGAIAHLVKGLAPAQLAWLDEQARSGFYMFSNNDPWWRLSPERVHDLVKTAGFNPTVIGVLTLHRNGFVRAAALEQLAGFTTGEELPFLALRANDWVAPVAARASDLLADRLRPGNRHAVLEALPFIARMFGQRRRDHAELAARVKSVLLSDGGDDALACANRFEIPARRFLYELLATEDAGFQPRVIRAAVTDTDPVIRARALRRLATDTGSDDVAAILERLLREDPLPAIRKLVLTVISERRPERIPDVLPSVLLDRAASVRELARFIVRTHSVPLVPRDLYVEKLTSTAPRQLAAAIEGIGETGTREDLDLLTRFLESPTPRVRAAVLRAFAKLDLERAIRAAITALADDSRSVRKTAVGLLRVNAHRVDLNGVSLHVQTLSNSRARQDALPLLAEASKWDAAVFLLDALNDPDEHVRTTAAALLDSWVADFNRRQTQPSVEQLRRIHSLFESVAHRLPKQTARLFRFSIQTG